MCCTPSAEEERIDIEMQKMPETGPMDIPLTRINWYLRILPDGTAQIIENTDTLTIRQEAKGVVEVGSRIIVEEYASSLYETGIEEQRFVLSVHHMKSEEP